MLKNVCVCVLAMAAITESFAIVPNAGADGNFTWVGHAAGGSGTAIARRTVITAKHATGSAYEILGTMYTAAYRINHPTMDIALLIFDEDLPGWHRLGRQAPVGSPISMVGLGRTGVVNSQGTGYDIHWWSGGTRLAAPGTVDLHWFFEGWGPSLISWLEVNGDGAGVSGDSGGGYFIDGQLVGVISYVFNNTGGVLPNYGFASLNDGVPYMGTGAIDLTDPDVRAWVLDKMVPAQCPADFDQDGFVSGLDFDLYVQAFEAGEADADFDEDGFVTGLDFDSYVRAFDAGC